MQMRNHLDDYRERLQANHISTEPPPSTETESCKYDVMRWVDGSRSIEPKDGDGFETLPGDVDQTRTAVMSTGVEVGSPGSWMSTGSMSFGKRDTPTGAEPTTKPLEQVRCARAS